MRADMAKVIVERPRYGSSIKAGMKKGYQKYVQKTDVADLPRREPMLGAWRYKDRSLNEHLGPMRRFLRSRVGRPWNRVHQELCEHVSFNNAVQKHILAHIFQIVRQWVYRHGKVLCTKSYDGGVGYRLRPGDLYICPDTGYLQVVREHLRTDQPRRISIRSDLQWHFKDGAWWEIALKRRPETFREQWDVWLDRRVEDLTKDDLLQAYGQEFFAVSKRPLTRDEIRQLRKRVQDGRKKRRPRRQFSRC